MDEHNLDRFVTAQARIYDTVRTELAAGRKRTHWMWFIFPQIEGLGSSPTAQLYAIRSPAEARAYLDHHLLGARLRACTELTLNCGTDDAHRIFGSPDDMKFRSSMTLFAVASNRADPFGSALARFFDGEEDPLTIARLRDRWNQERPGV
jgi:uncharacterized protein (DUF1810 family)